MRLHNSSDRYGAVPQALHWVVALLVLLAWSLGTFGDVLPQGSARATGLFIHISAGLAIAALVAVRLAWRLGDPPPPAEHAPLGVWVDRAARAAHWGLYALLVAVPVAGIALRLVHGDAVPVFGLFEIPSPWPLDRALTRSVKGIHELLADALMVLAGLHVAAALVHHWVFRDRTLLRMLPVSRG